MEAELVVSSLLSLVEYGTVGLRGCEPGVASSECSTKLAGIIVICA